MTTVLQRDEIVTTNGDVWTPAPNNFNSIMLTGDVQGVYLAADEDVEWIFDRFGNRVIGYKIKTKRKRCDESYKK